MKPSTVNTPAETQVEVVRRFDAPVDQVWQSFTVPKLVSRWMVGPPGWSMPVCEMDFRVGGRYENRFRDDEHGTEFGLAGVFREIETLRRIVQDESYGSGDDAGSEAVVTLTFEETDGVTTVATLVEYPSREARDAALATGMTGAMEMGYCRIDALLAS